MVHDLDHIRPCIMHLLLAKGGEEGGEVQIYLHETVGNREEEMTCLGLQGGGARLGA